jgi:hypothetical protein
MSLRRESINKISPKKTKLDILKASVQAKVNLAAGNVHNMDKEGGVGTGARKESVQNKSQSNPVTPEQVSKNARLQEVIGTPGEEQDISDADGDRDMSTDEHQKQLEQEQSRLEIERRNQLEPDDPRLLSPGGMLVKEPIKVVRYFHQKSENGVKLEKKRCIFVREAILLNPSNDRKVLDYYIQNGNFPIRYKGKYGIMYYGNAELVGQVHSCVVFFNKKCDDFVKMIDSAKVRDSTNGLGIRPAVATLGLLDNLEMRERWLHICDTKYLLDDYSRIKRSNDWIDDLVKLFKDTLSPDSEYTSEMEELYNTDIMERLGQPWFQNEKYDHNTLARVWVLSRYYRHRFWLNVKGGMTKYQGVDVIQAYYKPKKFMQQ